MKRFMRMPSPAMVVACLALFVALSGVSYAVATIGSDDIINGSIRNRDFKDGTLRGNEAKPDGFGPNAIKEQSLDASKLNSAKIGKVTAAALADGITRHGVVSSAGAPRARPRRHLGGQDRRRPVPGRSSTWTCATAPTSRPSATSPPRGRAPARSRSRRPRPT